MSKRAFDSSRFESESFEKIRADNDGLMPVGSNRRARSTARKTAASRRANKKVARRSGGERRGVVARPGPRCCDRRRPAPGASVSAR